MASATGGFIAGSIVGKLILDKSGWNNSVAEVEKDNNTMANAAKKHGQVVTQVGKTMAVAGTAIVGTLGLMIKKYVEAGDEIDKMSKRTGLAAGFLSEMRYAADITGTSISAVEKGVKKMSKTIVDASEGMTTYIRAFDRINLSVEDLIDLSPEEQFLKIGKAIAEVENPTIRAATAVDIFGRAGTQLLPFFAEGSKGIDKLREEAHRLGIVFDEETALKAAKLKDAQTALRESLKGLGFTLTESLIPVLTNVAKKITDVISNVIDWAKEHPRLIEFIAKVTGGLGAFMIAVGPILMALPGLVLAVKGLGGAFSAALGPIGLLATGFTVLIPLVKKYGEKIEQAKESSGNLGIVTQAVGFWTDRFNDVLYGAQSLLLKVTNRGEKLTQKQWELFAAFHGLHVEATHGDTVLEEYSGAAEKVSKKIAKITYEAVKLQTPAEILSEAVEGWKNSFAEFEVEIQDTPDVMTGVVSEIVQETFNGSEQIKTHLQEVGEKSTEVTTNVDTEWLDVSERMKDRWATALSDMFMNAESFDDFLSSIWKSIKQQFFDLISKMITEWLFSFVEPMMKSLADLSTGFDGFTKSASASGEAVAGASASGLAYVSTLGAIAGAIILVGGIIDFFTGNNLNKYWKEQQEQMDEMIKRWIELGLSIKEADEKLRDYIQAVYDANKAENDLNKGRNERKEIINPVIDKNRPGVGAGGGFQTGGAFVPSYSAMIQVDPGELVDITPLSELAKGVSRAGLSLPNSRNPNVSQNINFNIQAWDSRDTERWVRDSGLHLIERSLRENFGGNAQKIASHLSKYDRI